MNVKRRVVLAALVGMAAAVGPASQLSAAGASWGANKLEGAWVARVVGVPMQWSYVLIPGASERQASMHGSIDVGLSTFPGAVGNSPLIGEVVMTGPRTAKFRSVWYVLGPGGGGLTASILAIGTNNGEIAFEGPGKASGTHHLAFYPPSSDADGDGYPDPGAVPIPLPLPAELYSSDTRLPAQ